MSNITKGFTQLTHANISVNRVRCAFRFRKVEDVGEWENANDAPPEDELVHFVRLSDKSTFIAGAHPDLHGKTRYDLYQSWYNCCPEAFMFLEVQKPDGNWETISVSIILPLTKDANARLVSGEPNVVLNLTEKDIQTHPPQTNLLIDTWILDKGKFITAAGHAHGLVLKHLARFGQPLGKNLIVEPDAENMHQLAQAIGFDGPENGFYSLPITPERINTNPILKSILHCATMWKNQPDEIQPSR